METSDRYEFADTPEKILALPEEEFKRRYPEDGFGWVQPAPVAGEHIPGYELSKTIMERWQSIREVEKTSTDTRPE